MTLVTNGRLITRDSEGQGYYEHGAVAYEGTKIVEVGEEAALRAKYPQAEIIDAKGGVIMPAFINAHTHIYSALARGLSIVGNNPTNFYEVLDGTWWAMDRQLTLEGSRASATPCTSTASSRASPPSSTTTRAYGEIPGSLPDRGEREGLRHPLLSVLRGLRPRRRGEVPAGHPGKRRLHHGLRKAEGPHAGGHVRRPRSVHHLRQDL